MALFNNPAQVIAEAASIDRATMSDVVNESEANEFRSEYKNIETLEEDTIFYSEEVVPVFEVSNKTGVKGVVELENVVKFMECNDIEDIGEALDRIAEHYDIEGTELGIVIEADEELDDIVQEAKTSAKKGNKKMLGKVGDAAKALKDIKNKAIKVFKKPAKKKKK